MFYYTLFGLFRRGGSKTSLKLLYFKNINQRIESKFSQNIPIYIDFDGASLFWHLPAPFLKNGLILVLAMNSH